MTKFVDFDVRDSPKRKFRKKITILTAGAMGHKWVNFLGYNNFEAGPRFNSRNPT